MPIEDTQASFWLLSGQKEPQLPKTLFINWSYHNLLLLILNISFQVQACVKSLISKQFLGLTLPLTFCILSLARLLLFLFHVVWNWWCHKWHKGHGSIWAVTGVKGVNGLKMKSWEWVSEKSNQTLVYAPLDSDHLSETATSLNVVKALFSVK